MKIDSVPLACRFLIVFHAGTFANAGFGDWIFILRRIGRWFAIGMSVWGNIERISILRARNPFAILRMVGRCEDCFIR